MSPTEIWQALVFDILSRQFGGDRLVLGGCEVLAFGFVLE